MLAVEFYSVVVSVHVIAVVIAFGVTFAYPVIFSHLGPNHPQALGPFHEAQHKIGKLLITPFATLALITGIYLAADADVFGEIWVQVPMAILIILLGLGGAFFGPASEKLAELARTAPGGPEYMAKVDQVKKVSILADLMILTAIFFMIAKPGL